MRTDLLQEQVESDERKDLQGQNDITEAYLLEAGKRPLMDSSVDEPTPIFVQDSNESVEKKQNTASGGQAAKAQQHKRMNQILSRSESNPRLESSGQRAEVGMQGSSSLHDIIQQQNSWVSVDQLKLIESSDGENNQTIY